MIIKPAGNRNPKLNRIQITGAALSGKTTLAAKFGDSPLFISTDGNANRQGYMAIDFDFPSTWNALPRAITEVLNLAKQASNSWDVLVFDLIEGYDLVAQTLLRSELDGKAGRRAWGKIKALYVDLAAQIRIMFPDKVVVFLSRETEDPAILEYNEGVKFENQKKPMRYIPALRATLKDTLIPDIDLEIRCVVEGGKRQFLYDKTTTMRYPELQTKIAGIINKPTNTAKSQPSPNLTPDYIDKMAKKAAEKLGLAQETANKLVKEWTSLPLEEAYAHILEAVGKDKK